MARRVRCRVSSSTSSPRAISHTTTSPVTASPRSREAKVAVVMRVSISGGRSPSRGRRPLTKVGIPTSKAAPVARIATGGETRARGPPKRRTAVSAATATPPAITRSQSHPRCDLASPVPPAPPPSPGGEGASSSRGAAFSAALTTARSTASRSSTGAAKSSSARPVRGLTLTALTPGSFASTAASPAACRSSARTSGTATRKRCGRAEHTRA